MTTAMLPANRAILLIVACVSAAAVTDSFAGEMVSVRLVDGIKLTAELHPRTNDSHLWLQLSMDGAVVRRGIGWERIFKATHDGQPVSLAALRQLADEITIIEEADQAPTPPVSTGPSDADRARDLLGFTSAVAAVDFDARLANWDGDVEFDGIVLQLLPLTADGQLTVARGTLHVELIAARRQDFIDAPRARGQVSSRLGRWAIRIDEGDMTENGVAVKLPFRTNHPEFDTSWAARALVHVRFVVPGHGVFEHSFDGLQIRPYAPLRDTLERETGSRFFPTERTSVGK